MNHSNIVQKLSQLIHSTELEIHKIQDYSSSLIEHIQSKTLKTINELQDFIMTCTSISLSIKEVPPTYKDLKSPIISLLLSSNEEASAFLSNLTIPEIEIQQLELSQLFLIKYSNLPHVMSNFNSLSASYLRSQSIKTFNSSHLTSQLLHETLTATSAFLDLEGTFLMATGGKMIDGYGSLISDLSKYEITLLSGLNDGRGLHTMGWIDNKPAVIGGTNPKTDKNLNTVEIYTNSHWMVHSTLNMPRSRHTGCNLMNEMYLFGGIITEDNREKMTNSIERYKSGMWEVLNVALPCDIHFTGIVCASQSLFLVLGGVTSSLGGNGIKTCWKFNVETGDSEEILTLEKETMFYSNMWVITEKNMVCLDYKALATPYHLRYYVT